MWDAALCSGLVSGKRPSQALIIVENLVGDHDLFELVYSRLPALKASRLSSRICSYVENHR